MQTGKILAINTIGAFLGSVLTSLLLQYVLSASHIILLNGMIAFFLGGMVSSRKFMTGLAVMMLGGVFLNVWWPKKYLDAETGLANYEVDSIGSFKGLIINGSRYSSVIIDGNKLHPHLEIIHEQLLTGAPKKKVLVLGAGGFSFSIKNVQHDYHFIDVDPKMKEVTERIFLPHVKGRFTVSDARAFILNSKENWDVIIQDINDGSAEIPRHLLTREFFQNVSSKLNPKGYFAINMIHPGSLWSEEGARIVRTLQRVFTTCAFIPFSENRAADESDSVRQTLGICRKMETQKEITDNEY